MKFLKEKTLPMVDPLEKAVMTFILERVKRIVGLTTEIDRFAGINGSKIKPEESLNIRSNLLIRILIYMALHQGDDFKKDWEAIGDCIQKIAREHAPSLKKKGKERNNQCDENN